MRSLVGHPDRNAQLVVEEVVELAGFHSCRRCCKPLVAALDYIVVDCSGRQRSRHIAGEEDGSTAGIAEVAAIAGNLHIHLAAAEDSNQVVAAVAPRIHSLGEGGSRQTYSDCRWWF